MTCQQVAGAAPGRLEEGAGRDLALRRASALQPPAPRRPRVGRPRQGAQCCAPGALRRPQRASAPGSARRRRRRVQLLAPRTLRAERRCARVPDPATDAPGPAAFQVSLLHHATPKMNVRRVESISAQLEEASSTGGRMQSAWEREPSFHPPFPRELTGAPHFSSGGRGTFVAFYAREAVTQEGLAVRGGSGENGVLRRGGAGKDPG